MQTLHEHQDVYFGKSETFFDVHVETVIVLTMIVRFSICSVLVF